MTPKEKVSKRQSLQERRSIHSNALSPRNRRYCFSEAAKQRNGEHFGRQLASNVSPSRFSTAVAGSPIARRALVASGSKVCRTLNVRDLRIHSKTKRMRANNEEDVKSTLVVTWGQTARKAARRGAVVGVCTRVGEKRSGRRWRVCCAVQRRNGCCIRQGTKTSLYHGSPLLLAPCGFEIKFDGRSYTVSDVLSLACGNITYLMKACVA